MSRNIPVCRTYRVAFYDGASVRKEAIVTAPTKRLARWNAQDALFGCFLILPAWCSRVTIGRIRKRNMCGR